MDRNFFDVSLDYKEVLSLSARRAWIEILVAITPSNFSKSLSARRAWIEIAQGWRVPGRALVALRKESVDRNFIELLFWGAGGGRSPQGERG